MKVEKEVPRIVLIFALFFITKRKGEKDITLIIPLYFGFIYFFISEEKGEKIMEKEKIYEVTEVKDLWLNEEVNEEDSEIQEELQKIEDSEKDELLKKEKRLERRKDSAKKNLAKKDKTKHTTKGSDKKAFIKKSSKKNFRRSEEIVGDARSLHKKIANGKEHRI